MSDRSAFRWPDWVTVTAPVALVAVALGAAVGAAPRRWDAVMVLVGLVAAATVIGVALRPRRRRRPPRLPLTARQTLALTSMYLVLASTLVFRQRTAEELGDDPLDLAGQFRVAALAAAFVLACVAMISRRLSTRDVPAAGWWYLGYVAVVPLGAIGAVSPGLVMFKWVELVTFVVVWFALTKAFSDDVERPLRHLGIFVGLFLVSIVLGVVTDPGAALSPSASIIPFQLEGHQPQVTANDVGMLGAIVFAYGIARDRVSPGLMATGAAFVLAAQYRTGYVAVAAMVAVVLLVRRQSAARYALVALAVLIPVLLQTSTAEQIWVRGESVENLRTFTGRTNWWSDAVEVAERSPYVGTGLVSGVRYEVFEEEYGQVSTIHSTWIEAYVGAGLIGLALLLVAFVTAGLSAWSRAVRDGPLLPMTLMTLLAVRSLTGSSIDLGGLLLMVFLLAVSAAAAGRPAHGGRRPAPALVAG